MDKKLLELAIKHEAHSLYEYKLVAHDTIPVVIAESIVEPLVDDMRSLGLEKSIFLTVEDSVRGGDVFGVVLLHIQARSRCVYGEDILSGLQFDHNQIRTSLEAHLRHFLIDLREQIVAGTDPKMVQYRLHVVCDRMWCGLHRYLNGKKLLKYDQIHEFLNDLHHDWNLDLKKIWKDIGQNKANLMQVHHGLVQLLHKIDTMSENGIK